MTLLLVAVSGSVGTQVFKTSGKNLNQAKVKGIIITPSAANTTLKIRDGNASGEVVFYARLSATANSQFYEVNHKFTKGLHAKLLGAAAQAYLVYE